MKEKVAKWIAAAWYVNKFDVDKVGRHCDFVNAFDSKLIKLAGYKYDLEVYPPQVAYLPRISREPCISFSIVDFPLHIVHPIKYLNLKYLSSKLLAKLDDKLEIYAEKARCPFCGDDDDINDWLSCSGTPIDKYCVRAHLCEKYSLCVYEKEGFWLDSSKIEPEFLYLLLRSLYYGGENLGKRIKKK